MDDLAEVSVPFASKFSKEKMSLRNTSQLSTGKDFIVVTFATKDTVKKLSLKTILKVTTSFQMKS